MNTLYQFIEFVISSIAILILLLISIFLISKTIAAGIFSTKEFYERKKVQHTKEKENKSCQD